MSGVPPPPVPSPEPGRFQAGRFAFGLLVLLFGVAWLVEATDVARVPWDVVLPTVLIVIGLALVVASRTGRNGGGLVALGIVLTVLLALGTVVRIPFEGGVGDRVERPRGFGDKEYGLAVGKLTVDLRDLTWREGLDPAQIRFEGRVGIGQLLVVVPSRFPCVSVHGQVGVGEVNVFGERRGGISTEYRTAEVCTGVPTIRLELSVGIGEIEVRRG